MLIIHDLCSDDIIFSPGVGVQRGLDRHELGVHDVYSVPVTEPDLGVDLDHAPDAVMGPAQVQQVVVPQVPLAARVPLENSHRAVSQGSQHTALDMAKIICK